MPLASSVNFFCTFGETRQPVAEFKKYVFFVKVIYFDTLEHTAKVWKLCMQKEKYGD